MDRRNKVTWSWPAVLVAAGFMLPSIGCQEGPDDHILVLYETSADATRGGALYDKWWEVPDVLEPIAPGATGVGPDGEIVESIKPADNPYFMDHKPEDNSRSGNQTWRCKECHGWDYKGVAGAYGSGSHHTGFAGIYESREAEILDLYAVLARGELADATEEGHLYGDVLSDQDLVDLIAFIREGLVDLDRFVDPGTKAAIGYDEANGASHFSDNCASCHGADGEAINFKAGDYDSEFLGDLASGNPWEFFHKIRFGQPGGQMPNAPDKAYRLQDVVDILGHSQALGSPFLHGGSVARGGVLYDKWWAVNGADEPSGDNALYTDSAYSEGTKSGSTTWRCKECHGWDYRGADGAYSTGSHYTGIDGLWASRDKNPETLYEAIYNGAIDGGTHGGHAFGDAGLSEDDALDLARFVAEGLIDLTAVVDPSKRSTGDESTGLGLFASNCSGCHGAEGTAINFKGGDDAPAVEYVGGLARGNPWESAHKIRFGHPGSGDAGMQMPNMWDAGFTVLDVADVLAGSQTLVDTTTRGGQLWDKWWNVAVVAESVAPGGTGSSLPADNPYFMDNKPPDNTRSGDQTWRCKECHGWDYQGADGAYGSGSHYTGFSGVFGTELDDAELYQAIADGPSGMDDSHAFLDVIGEDGVRDLVNFVTGGVLDTGEFITISGAVAAYVEEDAVYRTRDANWVAGMTTFQGNCATCHGADGTAINFDAPDGWEVVGTLASDNPWEYMHKVRFGQPGSSPRMPNAEGSYYDLDTVTDLILFGKLLPE